MIPTQISRSFASDNNAGIHPEVLMALSYANISHTHAYGDDPFTEHAMDLFKQQFGPQAETFWVLTGTGANVLGLKTLLNSYHAVICSQQAHLNVDECGAPEHSIGCKLLPHATPDGKITPAQIKASLKGRLDQHRVQPRVVSLTQPTELGTVYSLAELRAICDLAHAEGLYVQMDGARLSNAAVALDCDLRALTTDVGVDVLSLGGTKNGLMFGEAVVFLKSGLAHDFPYIRKQGLQLASKMRFLAAQFEAFFSDDLWRRNALHANQMAQLLAQEVRHLPQITITQTVQTNAIFATLPAAVIPQLQREFYFYVWDEDKNEVRWMTSFDTTETDIQLFVACLRRCLGQ